MHCDVVDLEQVEAGMRRTISPGVIATPNVAAETPEVFEHFINDLQLVKRRGEMQDIVAAMLHLHSDDASLITGGYPLIIS